MTQTTYFLTNGNSLEDCHTNFFALADLCGIKWRQYSCDKNFNDLNDDPILSSFSRCINANLLCVWRRIRNTNNINNANTQDTNNPQQQNNYTNRDFNYFTKELWIFWYGDEPDLKDLVVPNLKEGEQGSWESGLSYECRTLLFKALHNLIERCLLSKGYSRIGRWFFQTKNRPQTSSSSSSSLCPKETGTSSSSVAAATTLKNDTAISDIIKEGTQITFRFNFFLHGDSNVCANVDVRQHTSIRPITRDDILIAQQLPDGIQVLLSPYGLQGYLTGHVYKDNDPNAQKLLSDWNKIYPLSSSTSNSSSSSSSANNNNTNINQQQQKSATTKDKLNDNEHFINNNNDLSQKIVEIIVDNNCRLKYPASYVFITDIDSELYRYKCQLQSPNNASNSSCPSSAQQQQQHQQQQIEKHRNFQELSKKLHKGSKEYLEQAKLLMTPYYNLKPNDSYYLRKNFNQINTVCDQIENKRDNSQSSSVKNGDIDYENNDNDKNNDEILILKNKCNCMKCINQIKHHQNKQCSLKQSSSSSSFTSMGKNISKDIKKWSSSSSQLLKNLSAINSSPFHHRVMNEIDLNNQFNSLHKLSKSSTTAAAVSTSSSIATLKNDDNSSKLTGEQSINNNNSQFKNTSGNNSNGPSTCDSSSSNPSFIQQQQQSQDHLHSQPTRPPSLPLSHHHQHNHLNSNIHIENTTIDPTARSNQQQMIKSIPQPSQPSPVPPIKEESALANLIAASTPILSNSHNNNQMIHRSLSPAIVNSDQSSTLKDSNNNNGDIDTKESVITNGYSNKRSKSSSFYDDDIAYKLLNGLLYDFSDEKLINNDWDFNDNDLPMKNRRFKSSHHFSSNNLYDASTHIINGDYNSNLDNNSRSALCDYNPPQQTDKSSKSSSTPMINKLLSSSSMNNDNNSEVLRSNLSCNTNNNNVSNIHGNDIMNVSSQSADNNNQFIKAKLSSSTENELINKNINAVNYNNTNINTNLHNHSKISEKLIVNHNGNLFVKNGEILPSDLEFLNSPLEEEQQLQQQQMNHKNNPNHIEAETILPATTTNASATSSTSNNSTSVLGVAELSRMFPTPPSLEAMVSSPSSSFVTNDAQTNKPFNHNDKNNDIDTDSMPINNANTIINNNNNNSVNNNNQINIRTELQSLNNSMVNNNTINANQNQIITNKLKPLNDLESNEQALVYMPPVQSIFITSDKYLPLCNVECKDTLPPNFHYKHNTNINHRRSTNHSNQHHNNSDHHYHSHHQQLQQNHPYHHNNHPGMRSFSPNFPPFPNGGHPLNHQQQQQTPFFKLNQRFPSNHSIQQQNMNNTKMGQPFSSPMIRVPRSSSTNYPISPMTPGSSPLPPPPHSMHPSHSRLRQQISPLPSGGAGGGHSPYSLIDCNMNSPGSMLDNRRSPFMFPQPTQPGMMMAKNPMMMMSPYGPHSPHPSHLHHISNDNHLSMTIECNSLMLNLLLSDSMFNLFRDHNFESCSICVCNMNIKGNDYGIYLPEQLMHKDHNLHHQQQNNDQNCLTCTCGFSAISNRHLSYFAGLFYEDEVEITGVYYDPIEANKENLLILPSSDSHQKDQTTTIDAYIDKELRKCLSTVNDDQYIKLLLNQSTTIYPSTSTLANIMYCDRLRCYNNYDQNLNNQPLRSNKSHQVERLKNPLRLMYEDYTAIIQMSLQITRLDCHTPGPSTPKLFQHGGWPSNSPSQSHIGNNTGLNRSLLHDWQFINSNHPVNNHEVMLTLKTLQPLMQESVQRKGSMNEVTYNTVKGPLTWRQFHRLAGRGTECQCEPQPIPSLLVGYDRECVAMSPFGLKFWEKLSLEPYAITRDIYYVVIIQSEMESQLSKIRNFFKELSATYEILRLGRHIPLGKLSSDSGIYVAGKSSINNNNDQQNNTMDDWFQQLGNSDLAEKIRSFAKALYDLSPSFTPSAVGERLMKSSFHNNSAYSMGQQQHHDLSSSSSNMNNGINSNNANQQQSHLHHSHHQQQQQHQHHNHHHITMNGTSSSSYTSSSNAVTSNSLLSSSFNKNSQNINNNNNIQQSKSSLNNGINNNNNTNGPTQQQQSDNNAANNNNNNQILNDLDTSHGSTSNQDSHNQSNTSTTTNNAFQPYDEEEDPHKYPSVMIYVLESFSPFGKEMTKLGSIGLLKTFSLLKKYFPEQMRNNIHMQMLSIDSVCSNDKDFRDYSRLPQLKELAFASYGQCKQQLVIQSNIKSLTGLGPAASFDLFLKNKSSALNRTELFTTPYILASLKDKQTELTETFGDRRERSQILYCGYCLTEDKKWLIASCTNDRGDILHTKVININIPNRLRRRKASIRRFGLDKLMKFIQTVMAESVMPWRLVIGRVGRIGHGELRDWTFLLSKKSLQKYSRQLKEMCNQCRYVGPNDQPAIYSACLISLEADTALRVFPNYYTPDERFSSSCNTCGLSTPEDASCTHILVFPTSATTQSSHTNFNLADEFFGDLGDDNLESDIPVDEDDFLDFFSDDILHRDGLQPDSPSNRQMFDTSDSLKNSSLMEVDHDEPTQLSQQPLALAFYVSTARTGPLPRWFWSHCPHLENTCPVFLKSALLIHTPSVHQNTDDLFHSNNRDGHSLDSNLTTDVLRYSLEGYNALSWLILDPSTNDRLSCLPLHIQVLMQLYHTIQALVQ